MEIVETLFGEEFGGSVVEVRIELMDDALEAEYGEQTGRES